MSKRPDTYNSEFVRLDTLKPWPRNYKTHGSRLKQFSKNNDISFDRFIQNLEQIPANYVENVMQSLPNEWYNDRYVSKIIEHLNRIFANIDKFHRGLLEIFI